MVKRGRPSHTISDSGPCIVTQRRRDRPAACRTRRERNRPMGKLLRPSFIIPVILSAALVAALLAFGNIGKVVAIMQTFQHSFLIAILLLLIAYEAVQYIQWHLLLRAQGINVPQR